MIYFTGEVSGSSPGWPSCARKRGKRIEEAFDSFMHASLGSGGYSSVGRAPLLQLGRCDYGNGEEDRNMPLKDSTETKRWAVKNVEEVGWAVGQIYCPLSGWAVRVGEGQSLVLKTSILKIKESGGKGGELFVPGSPVAGFSGTARILRHKNPENGIPTQHPLRF
ncbi:hypothetical protein HPP92_028386 [Vanilla planifolia]|uniref:Uncharacterized protein n=1 Tax=Vanilla planifolia TaxID=51239 RepID=A0A835P7E8_VANPL|nr:hypothetical protein HPP92_028386 [Vanilla planifolia]